MIDLDKIEQAARAALLWECEEHGPHAVFECDGKPGHDVDMEWADVLDCDLIEDCMPQTREFLDRCSPDVVLAMVARIRELERSLDIADYHLAHYDE